ncbi:MAG: polysaccharide deacetylase [Clostridia bacterium]|nr:polysaccharide deacetylase [Clostridia bacterium]
MEKDRLEALRKKRAERKRKQRIRLLIVVICFAAIIFVVVFAVKSAVTFIKNSIPTPTPSPVAVVSELGEPSAAAQTGEAAVPQNTAEPVQYAELANPSEQNDILKYFEENSSQKKVCYLTFDDGPNNSVTPLILDTLRRYNIKATFFQVGTLIEDNFDMAKRVYEEGHLTGNHSYDHTYSKIYADGESFINEFNKCSEQIKKVTGDDYFPIMRFPGGSFDAGSYGAAKQEYKTLLAQAGVYHCDWNALTGDAEGSPKTTEQMLERIKSSSKNKNQLVVLMHDANNKKQTAEALPKIIEYLISEGYTFSRLDKPIF